MEEKLNYKTATPKQVEEWHKEDFWMRMDFDPMVMFVVIPAIIQITVFGLMLAVFAFNDIIF
jgi:hypothetical protein